MIASTDSYTKPEVSKPRKAFDGYETFVEIPAASIVLSAYPFMYLNQRIDKLLDEYSKLQNNWDEDDAIAPSEGVISWARYTASLLGRYGQSIYHATPGPNGEIMLNIRNVKTEKSLEIIFYTHRSVLVEFSKEEKPVQKNFDIYNMPSYIGWLNRK
ncbi:MAG: hypothetical protein ABI844_01265 [Saprospiraceae bacterium]